MQDHPPSTTQLNEHPSPETVPPSSQPSPESIMLFPHKEMHWPVALHVNPELHKPLLTPQFTEPQVPFVHVPHCLFKQTFAL